MSFSVLDLNISLLAPCSGLNISRVIVRLGASNGEGEDKGKGKGEDEDECMAFISLKLIPILSTSVQLGHI